jgi:hypothetical protein
MWVRYRWSIAALLVGILLGMAAGAFIEIAIGTERVCSLTSPPRCGPTKHFQGDVNALGLTLGGIIGFAAAVGIVSRRPR